LTGLHSVHEIALDGSGGPIQDVFIGAACIVAGVISLALSDLR